MLKRAKMFWIYGGIIMANGDSYAQNNAARGEEAAIEALQNECDFGNYLKMLKGFAQKYCVMAAAHETPWGKPFTRELTRSMNEIGFKVDLYGKARCAYAGFICMGRLVFEKIEEDNKKPISTTLRSSSFSVRLRSVGYDSHLPNLTSCISINKNPPYPPDRGLNFVVYDHITQTIIDCVCFDIAMDAIPATRVWNYPRKIHAFCDAHPGVTVIPFIYPYFPKSDFLDGEKFIKEHSDMDFRRHRELYPDWPFKKYFENVDIKEITVVPGSYFDVNGVRRFEDVSGKYVNTSGGHRVTSYQPNTFDSSIYFCGQCSFYGFGSDDSNTIASHLQKLINEKLPEYKIIVQNYGFFFGGMDKQSDEKITILEALPVKAGDIVICDFIPDFEQFYHIDLSHLTEDPRPCEIFLDSFMHFTPDGNRLMAEKIFESLSKNNIFEKSRQLASESRSDTAMPQSENNVGFDENSNEQLAEYKKFLIDFYNSSLDQNTGAIVMNCNPFTLGHRYLIEKALEQCSFLIIFLVEEDKSEFPFEDRLMLVDEGTKDIPNLAIIPSGKFVLSSLTFSEYFNKSELQDRVIDTSLDVTVFAREIAPCLHITKRFAGEEPLDNVTRQYNETMRKVLPEYGIEFVEIPRAMLDENTPISASYVRSLLKKKDLEAIKKLVPESTLHYLQEKYD